MILVHAENGDLIAQVSGVCFDPFHLSLLLVEKVWRRGLRAFSMRWPGSEDPAKDGMACQTCTHHRQSGLSPSTWPRVSQFACLYNEGSNFPADLGGSGPLPNP